jgi:hypothetical protein
VLKTGKEHLYSFVGTFQQHLYVDFIKSIIMFGIVPKQNDFKFKIAPLKQISIVQNIIWQEDGPPGQRGPVLKHT